MHRALLLFVFLAGCPAEESLDSTPFDDDDSLAWDAAPPEDLPDGTLWRGVLSCGLFDAPVERSWLLQEGVWTVPGSGSEDSPRPRDEVIPCMESGPKTMTWAEDGQLSFEAAGWTHVMQPSTLANRWLGDGTPMHEPSRECVDGLAEIGLELPVGLSLTLTELETP